jgi:hypothetical protein
MRLASESTSLVKTGCSRVADGGESGTFSRQSAGRRRYFFVCVLFLFGLALPLVAAAGSWDGPAHSLAQKIAAVTGPGAVAVTVENRSSLRKKDVDAIGGLIRVELESLGARPVKPEQAAASVAVWLSENPQSYVWVAEIRVGVSEPSVVMVEWPRSDEGGFAQESVQESIRKIALWTQEDRILDVLVLEEQTAPTQIAVLDGEKVAFYRMKNGKWVSEQSLPIAHARPWPRDLRGRIMPAQDHLFDVYLPGVLCRSTKVLPLALSCRDSDDPWPLLTPDGGHNSPMARGPALPALGAFYSASRNFFTGALTPGTGKLTNVGKFYSAAPLLRERYVLWLFAETDGEIHLVDGVTDQAARLGWGSDIASVRTPCSGGWQVLATSAGDLNAETGGDSVRAYEVADRDPAPVSAALTFSGEITALWSEAKGDSAIAVARNWESGEYEAFRLGVVCSQ